MLRAAVFLGIVMVTFLLSCEKCMRCSYTYTVTTIEQTINGEEEVVNEYTGYVFIDDTVKFDSECIKGQDAEFTIENMYAAKGDTTVLDNYEYNCVEL